MFGDLLILRTEYGVSEIGAGRNCWSCKSGIGSGCRWGRLSRTNWAGFCPSLHLRTQRSTPCSFINTKRSKWSLRSVQSCIITTIQYDKSSPSEALQKWNRDAVLPNKMFRSRFVCYSNYLFPHLRMLARVRDL